ARAAVVPRLRLRRHGPRPRAERPQPRLRLPGRAPSAARPGGGPGALGAVRPVPGHVGLGPAAVGARAGRVPAAAAGRGPGHLPVRQRDRRGQLRPLPPGLDRPGLPRPARPAGAAGLGVIVLIGWGMRRLLDRYHLLQVPRTAVLLTLV